MDAFGKIVEIIISVILLFIAPVFIVAGIKDISNQIYVNTQTVLFVDTIRNQGYMDKELYESYLNGLSATGNVYDINMIHSGQMYGDDYEKYYIDFFSDEILTHIKTDKYKMCMGDLFLVELKQKNDSLFDKMFSIVIRDSSEENSVLSYGGIVRDETY